MISKHSTIRLVAGLAMLMLADFVPRLALAAPRDYRFEPAQNAVKTSTEAQFSVQLIHVPSGKPVTNAVIFQTRLDMSPMGMKDMTARVAAEPAPEPGHYAFRAPLTMAGDWMLHLAAKVPGETETVRGSVMIKATK